MSKKDLAKNIALKFREDGYGTGWCEPVCNCTDCKRITHRLAQMSVALVRAECARELREFVDSKTWGNGSFFVGGEILKLADTWEGKE